jgi:hypothetical protein
VLEIKAANRGGRGGGGSSVAAAAAGQNRVAATRSIDQDGTGRTAA